MALSADRVLEIVESGLSAAGDLVSSATLERETGAATYDPVTLKMTAGSVSSTPCRFLREKNDDSAPADDGARESQSVTVGYLADLAATPPKNSDRLTVGAVSYVIEEVDDQTAGAGHLFKVKIVRV